MDKAGSGSESAATTVYNTVFIRTNLETHLAMIVPNSDTVSDLKKKIVYEHTLCFPNIGEIKVHALKVKRRGCFYYLSDLMPVKSAFDGVSKTWFLSVDASSGNGQKEISNSCKSDSRNKAAHFDITNNNYLADVVDLLPDGPSRRLSNIDDSLLLQVLDKQHQEQNPIAEQFGSRKIKKTGGNDSSLIDHGVSTSDAVKGTSRQQEMTTSNYSLHKNLERGIAISENTELLGDNHRLTDTASGRKRKRKEQASNPSQVVGVISSEREVEETIKLPQSIEDDVSNTGVGSGESKNEAADSEAALVEDVNMLVNQQHASHVEDHSSPMIQEPSNLMESGVTGHENQTVRHEDGTVEVGKSLRKRKKSRKAQGPDVETTTASGTEHLRESSTGIGNGESRSKAADLEAVPMKDTIMLVDYYVSHVEDHSSPMIQEPRSLRESMVTGHENQTVVVEDGTVEAGKSLRKRTKSRKAQGLDVETSIALGTEHLRESLGDVSPTEPPISDKAEKSGSTDLKEVSKLKMVSATPADYKGTDEVIQDVLKSLHVLESLHQYSKHIANQDMDKKSKKKTKKKRSSTLVENVETKAIDDPDHYNPKASIDNVRDVNLSAETSKETKLVNKTLRNKLNRSKESHNNAEVEGNSEALPLQDVIGVNCLAINFANDDNKSINVPCEDNRIENQHQNKAVASSEKHADKVTEKRAADSKAKATRKKKMLDLPFTGSSPNLQRSLMSSENHNSGGDAQVTSSDPIQNQRSFNESDRVMVQSNKKLPSISLSREKLPGSTKSEKLITPEEAQTPIVTNSSNMRTQLKFSASTSSSLQSCKSIVHKNKSSNAHQSHLTVKKAQRNDTAKAVDSSERRRGLIATSGTIDVRGNESPSHVAVRKAQSNNNGEVVDSSARKRSLLAMSSTVFKDDGKESSADEDKTDSSDASTRTPSDQSSSSESSDGDADSSTLEHGSYSSKGQGSSGRNKKSLPSSPRSMPLEAILRSSTRYKQAKLTFSPAHYNDTESQPDEFVPNRQRK